MSVVAPAVEATPKRGFRWRRLLTFAAALVAFGAAAQLLGWDVRTWLSDFWDTISEISAAYLVGGVALKTVQTTLTAFAWYSILRFAYPERVRWLDVLACYAASVALNGILPANLGTLALLLMFTTIIAGASFAAILGAYAVEKIFFTLIGAFTYLYLFLSVGGSFDIKFAFVHEHPWATALLLLAGGYLIYLIVHRLWPKVLLWWEDAKEGGSILAHPRKYMLWVFVPSLLGWIASLGVMTVFLSAYDIPVSFHTLMRIAGGNSIANVTSATPGGAGVNQAFNVASLKGIASPQDATAYSVAQQLVTTAWNIIFGIVMLVWAFGWSGGRQLVGDSYTGAKEKAAEQKAAHAARKEAKREAKAIEQE
ncbi:MAG TPA: lysylphosphatidylglycerol synthase transmembrane domain-containing protein [Gaiellaceae bacterium]|nr:lysylphosphatidylglycerol synthase transmembrane domain-containing protein [Gaiellaceae bacterium]